jgi:chemotaxis protein methyltransferase CheR
MPDGSGYSIIPSAGPASVRPSANLLSEIADYAHTHFGMTFGVERRSLLGARVTQLAAERRTTVDKLVEQLRSGDRAVAVALAEALSTNHTYFFREAEVLEHFKSVVLEELRPRSEVRIWSAACSSGDEPYSLAMMTLDAWGAADAKKRASILGTDISQRMVADAEAGLYGARHVAGVTSNVLRTHFRAAGMGQFVVAPDVKALCQFRRLNLTATPWPFQRGFHVIFLRNVLYYFDQARQRQVMEACYDAALPGAYLYTSLTEPLHDVVTRWKAIAPAIYRKAPSS